MKNDQRLFYRIDVVAPCSYRIISHENPQDEELPPSNPDPRYIEEYFMKDLNELDEQINDVISQINVKSNLLASALSAMNSKINFILQTIHVDQLTRAIPQRMINLSGGGLSMVVNEYVDSRDEFDVLIHPIASEQPVLIRCAIVNVTPLTDDEESYRVSLKFLNLPEEERRKILFFIQSKEIELANKDRD